MKIFSFILTIALLLPALTNLAQETETKPQAPGTAKTINRPGLRIGIDITRPFQKFWTKGDRFGSDLSADLEVKPNLFAVVETGWEKLKIDQPYVDYQSSGTYMRAGADYNVLSPEADDKTSTFCIGVRYGYSIANQQVNSYVTEGYWGQARGSFPKQQFNSHWIETVLSLKGEILKNFYMGWSVRTKFMLSHTPLEIPSTYFTPGYGKSESSVALDFTYSIYYNFPFKFRKNAPR